MIALEDPRVDAGQAVRRIPIDRGWEAAVVLRAAAPTDVASAGDPSPGTWPAPFRRPPSDATWLPATVPGTAASVLRAAGRPIPHADMAPVEGPDDPSPALDLDEADVWFRTTFDADRAGPAEEVLLRIGGIATLSLVVLNGLPIATSRSMFEGHAVDVGSLLRGRNELIVAIAALGPELRRPRGLRQRWRTAIVADGAIRWFRTTLLGRAPGFAPGPPVVGPWRPITLERRTGIALDGMRVRARLDEAGVGRLSMSGVARSLAGEPIRSAHAVLDGPDGARSIPLTVETRADGTVRIDGDADLPGVTAWWPHTHGVPALHRLKIELETNAGRASIDAGRVGFRSVAAGPAGRRIAVDGLDLRINGRPIFARGAVWTPADPERISADDTTLRASLERVRAAGMNMIRIPGVGAYEDDRFHDLCDELGILVWQDLAFANLDYPFGDAEFHATCAAEVDALIERLAGRPSLAVVCGNSEIEQQVAMLGLDPDLGRNPFFADELGDRLTAAECDAIALPSTPTGGDQPFRTDTGIAHFYGAGGYRRPLADTRSAAVRFAAECLAFSNLPDDADDADPADPVAQGIANGAPRPGSPAWKAGIPRDRGAEWDFEDVRDHYLRELYGVDPEALRRSDPGRWIELGRQVTGEVMAEVFGEWRRAGSPSSGGLVMWWQDQRPGAGWGLLDDRGRPKLAWHHVRRALAPTAVWMTDEGLNGIRVHVANDRPDHLAATLRIATYRSDGTLVEEAATPIVVGAGETVSRDVEAILGRFVDVGWTYRFGPAVRSLVVASLEDPASGGAVLSRSFHHPLGRPAERTPVGDAGLTGWIRAADDGTAFVSLQAQRYAHGVRISVPGYDPDDDGFGLEPGRSHEVRIRPRTAGAPSVGGLVVGTARALNLDGSVALVVEDRR